MQKFETNKLFFDQYSCKLNITSPLSIIFRGNNLSYARKKLDKLQLEADANQDLLLYPGTSFDKTVSLENFETAKKLYQIFKTSDIQYKLRIEHPNISIYCNDCDWLVNICKILNVQGELWEPNKAYVDLLENNVLLVANDNGHKYRCTLSTNYHNQCNWLVSNQDKVKVGPVLLDCIKNNNCVEGLYFYVRDEKILQLISLCGIKLRRVDRLVLK